MTNERQRMKAGRAKGRPLSGVRVLVGRARHQASALSTELRRLGAEVIEIPFIEIRKPKSFRLLDAALKNLASYDWLILTSVNGVEALWQRLAKIGNVGRENIPRAIGKGTNSARATSAAKLMRLSAAEGQLLRIAAIGPATQKAIEQRGVNVDVVPKEYVAESVVRSLRRRVKGKRVLLVRAKVARDVIPRELRAAGARVDVVEAYETVNPKTSRTRLRAALNNLSQRPDVVTFTSSSAVRNFVTLLEGARPRHTLPDGILLASIGPVTSSTLRELGMEPDIQAKEYTIPGLVKAIVAFVET
jgi:uroporphyrinogen-III synthase